jgi:hypothetical protein
MSRCFRIVIAAVVAIHMAAVASAQAKKLQQSDLPEAVQATAAKETAQGKVTAYWQRDQDGAVVYEVDLVVDGHARGVLINSEGAVVAVQDEVPWNKLDPSIQSGIQSQAGDGKVATVYSISRDGKLLRYIAIVDKGGQKTKVEVGADGAPPATSPGS